ncbi:MAG: glycosyltransferase family 2 protein, partial [Lachnospiraceae bacterium]|nr:glycosyltransferase family 2 protein [Lachnospiraceae bacterium]
MDREPLLSIIIPVYNTEPYLEKCVNSCLAQTYRNLEILLVDDGSTDGSKRLCDTLAERDCRIRVFHKENGGSSSARNLGIREAKGEYLGFVDSDDYIGARMYELLYAAISGKADQKKVLIAQISRDEIDEDGNHMPDVCAPPKEEVLCDSRTFLRELLLHRGDCSFCTKLVHRSLMEDRQFPEGKLNEDFYLLTQLLPETEGIRILPQQEYHVFYRVGSNTRKTDKNEFSRVFTDIVENADYITELTEREYPELRREALRFNLYQRLDYMLHIPVPMMTGKNDFYLGVKSYLRKHLWDTVINP